MASILRRIVGLLSLFSVIYAAPSVRLGNTNLVGRDIPTLGQEFFGGIPFAKAPVGQLRLKPPVPAVLNSTSFDASQFGLACLQPGLASNVSSEDCLTINVLRPAGLSANTKLPVMAWIYGGGFRSGTASTFNASAIVAQSIARGTPVIYVNFNYRIGPLGFPQGQEAADRGAVNLGLKDQLTALAWIQHNISLFGGDPRKVTLFGESAGAISIAVLFLNSNLDRFVRAAIFESGSAATVPAFEAAHLEQDWQAFVSAIPACAGTNPNNTFECLQSDNLNATTLNTAITFAYASAAAPFPFAPNLDGPDGLFPDLPSRLFAQGKFTHLPFIAGTNLDEGTAFTPTAVNSTEEIDESLLSNFSPTSVPPMSLEMATEILLELYPDVPALGSPFNTGNQTFGLSSQYKRTAAITGDLQFQSQRRQWIQAVSSRGVKVFGYLFADPQAVQVNNLPASSGVTHGSELLYVYGAVPSTVTPARQLSTVMVDYWISFATSLDPNDGLGVPRPQWTQYTPANQAVIELNGLNTSMIPDDYRAEQITFINTNSVTFRHRRSW